MYINNFINDKYIAFHRYCIYLNRDNSSIVDLKYENLNSILLLRKNSKKFKAYSNSYLLSNLRKEDKITRILRIFRNLRISSRKKKYIKYWFLKYLKFKSKKIKIKIFDIAKKSRHYYFINTNVNYHKHFKKNKLLKFILNKLLKKQVFSNALPFDAVLSLNLHPLFFRRFKTRFLFSLSRMKYPFNFNKYHWHFIYRIIPKMLNFIYLFSYLIKVRGFNVFNKLYYNLVYNKFFALGSLRADPKYFNKFIKYIVNLRNINYINVSFNLVKRSLKKKKKRIIRRYLKKYKKFNFFIFLNLAFIKLIIFLFLYWFNNLIVILNFRIKSNILSLWFKPIRFIFKTYVWRKKRRFFYLKFNEINNFIFFNFKRKLLN
jgi:hypothetical protein